MIEASSFVDAARRRGFALWTGVPCSYLQPLINRAMTDTAVRYVHAGNEGEAVAIAAGAELAGGRAVAMLQNSGLGNAVSPLTSLTFTHRIPVLLIVTLRGEPGGAQDEPQHALMGSITARMLDLMQIRAEYFPGCVDEIEPCLDRAVDHMVRERLPYGLMMRKDTVAASPVGSLPSVGWARPPQAGETGPATASRDAMLTAMLAAAGERDVIVSTTGYTSRALYALGDRGNQLYLVGAMGCASSVGLGVALQRPDLRVIVIDGDGAAIMRLGALAAIGGERPPNLLHVVLDNGLHESTGGQATAARWTDLAAVAAACGYPRVRTICEPGDLARVMGGGTHALTFVRAMIVPGVADRLPRPAMAPPAVTDRFRTHLQGLPKAGS